MKRVITLILFLLFCLHAYAQQQIITHKPKDSSVKELSPSQKYLRKAQASEKPIHKKLIA